MAGKPVKPALGPGGARHQLHWAPKPADLAACKAFWSMPGVVPVFMLSAEEPSEPTKSKSLAKGKVKELTPEGVAFVLEKVLKLEPFGKLHRLPVAV